MFINKIGFQHITYGTNCQDFGFDLPNFKGVADGCSQGKHSEVGAKLFCHFISSAEHGYNIESIFKILTSLFKTPEAIQNYLLFTFILVKESEDEFLVFECGDGYVVTQDIDDNIEFEEINYGEASPYYAYNYLPKEMLSKYKGGVKMNLKTYPKSKFKKVGVASDGLKYIIGSDYEEKLKEAIVKNKPVLIDRFMNLNQSYQYLVHQCSEDVCAVGLPKDYNPSKNNFKDDFTLVI